LPRGVGIRWFIELQQIERVQRPHLLSTPELAGCGLGIRSKTGTLVTTVFLVIDS